MDTNEILENYLISNGCSISNKYGYILDDNYDYLKDEKSKKVEIASKTISLDKPSKNTVKLNVVMFNSKYILHSYMTKHLNEMTSDIANFSNFLFNAGLVYFTDYLKYLNNKFSIDEKLLNNLINLTNANIKSLKESLNQTIIRHQNKMNQINQDITNSINNSNARTIAEAANAARYTFGQVDYSSSLFGDGYLAYGSSFSVTGKSQATLNNEINSNISYANFLGSKNKNIANQKILIETYDMFLNLIDKFNFDLKEILMLKLPNLFNEYIINNDSDLQKNPTNLNSWMKIVKDINKEDFDKLKEILDFYELNILSYIKSKAISNILNYYNENNKCDYEDNYLQLYSFFTNNGDITLEKDFQNKIYNSVLSKASSDKLKLDDKVIIINDCDYLIKENKDKIIKKFRDEKKATKKFNKSILTKVILLIIPLIAIIAFLVYFILGYFGKYVLIEPIYNLKDVIFTLGIAPLLLVTILLFVNIIRTLKKLFK